MPQKQPHAWFLSEPSCNRHTCRGQCEEKTVLLAGFGAPAFGALKFTSNPPDLMVPTGRGFGMCEGYTPPGLPKVLN